MSIQDRVYRFDCKPTPEQQEVLSRWEGNCRFLWNLCIEQYRLASHYRLFEFKSWQRPPNWTEQSRQLTELRREQESFNQVSRILQDEVLDRVKKAMRGVYERRLRMPRFKRRDQGWNLSFKGYMKVKPLNANWGAVFLSKQLGWIRFRWENHPLPQKYKLTRIKVKRKPKGWEVQIGWKGEVSLPCAKPETMVAIDRGVSVPVMCGDGQGNRREFHLPPSIAEREAGLQARLHALQRQLPRAPNAKKSKKRKQVEMTRGSRRHRELKARIGKTHWRIANIRREWQHETAHAITSEYGLVAMEKLTTRNMTRSAKGTRENPGKRVKQKSGLNRSILNVGWDGLAHKIEYRAREAIFVPAAGTSQTCCRCGHEDKDNRKTQAQFKCKECGFAANADWNATQNILARAIAQRAGTAGTRPVDSRGGQPGGAEATLPAAAPATASDGEEPSRCFVKQRSNQKRGIRRVKNHSNSLTDQGVLL